MNDENLLVHLKADFKASEVVKNDNDANVETWEKVNTSKPYGTETAHKSKYVSDMTQKLLNWQIPSIVEPLVNSQDLINCKPFTHLDTAIAEQEQSILTFQLLQTMDHYAFITNLVTDIARKGTCFVKTGWEFKEELQEVEEPVFSIDPITGEQVQIGTQSVDKMVTLINRPTRSIRNLLDIRMDPTCKGNIGKAAFVIDTFKTNMSELKSDGRYSNLDKVVIASSDDEERTNRDTEDPSFNFEDNARKEIIVHEYWGNYDLNGDGITEPIVVAWVGDVIIRKEDNPLPGQAIPFVKAVYTNKTDEIYGEPLAALTGKKQHIDSILMRGIFDDMKLANNGQTGTKKGFTDEDNLRKMKQGLDFEYNTTMADVFEDSYKGLNQSVFNVLDRNAQDGESMTGVSAFNHGSGGNALGSSAAAVNATTTSSAKREMHIVRGIAETCLIPMLKMFSQYNSTFLTPEEVERITDKPYVEVNEESSYNIKMTLESAETRAAKAQSTGFVLQTMGPSMPQQSQQLLLARYMKLVGEPDIAYMIENPQPDPAQEEAAQKAAYIQDLEIKKLEAEIANEIAKGNENAVDVELKKAKTREINSGADLKDLDYLEQEQGIPHQRELEKQELNNKTLFKIKSDIGA